MKNTLLILSCLIVISCKNNSIDTFFSQAKIDELTNLLEADHLALKVDDNVYNLLIDNSQIKKTIILEEFSKIVALELFNAVSEKLPEIYNDPEIRIIYKGAEFMEYQYKFSFLSEIDQGIKVISKVFDSLRRGNQNYVESFYINQKCYKKTCN